MKILFYLIVSFFEISSIFGQGLPPISNDPPSVHGMLVVGEKSVYLSHLPMFHRPHDYQVILEVDIGNAAKTIYLGDKKAHPQETVYTLVPESFILPQMVQNPKPFRAKLFRGHFERGGAQIVNSTTVNIIKVVYFKKFEKETQHPKNLHYILFGNLEDDLFLVHIITTAPDFDQVLGLKASRSQLTDSVKELLQNQSSVIFDAEQDNNKPLLDGATVTVKDLTLNDVKQYYLEFDDLSF